jgi:hypothetical protein
LGGSPTVYALTLGTGKTLLDYVVLVVTLLLSLKYDFVVITAYSTQAHLACCIVQFLRGHLYSKGFTHLRFPLLC